jgi:phosphoribosylformylglycinamidine synthase
MIRNTHAITTECFPPTATMPPYSPGRRDATLQTRTLACTADDEPIDILIKVETHNHPTAIAPFPGAATRAGGEIRDEGHRARRQAQGRWSVYGPNLRIPGHSPGSTP